MCKIENVLGVEIQFLLPFFCKFIACVLIFYNNSQILNSVMVWTIFAAPPPPKCRLLSQNFSENPFSSWKCPPSGFVTNLVACYPHGLLLGILGTFPPPHPPPPPPPLRSPPPISGNDCKQLLHINILT